MRGATCHRFRQGSRNRYFNPRSSCEERLGTQSRISTEIISIHAPHARSDLGSGGGRHRRHDISIHAPHARSDCVVRYYRHRIYDFNPRSSCEERPLYPGSTTLDFLFQSTLLMRGATAPQCQQFRRHYFNPRSSCEERQCGKTHNHISPDFNPRSSCEERHNILASHFNPIGISIHAPHARSDSRSGCRRKQTDNFNPRSSCEERPSVPDITCWATIISIHAPHARSDSETITNHINDYISIHAPHARSDCVNFRH